jgi:phosphoribosylanthranilate isomerase
MDRMLTQIYEIQTPDEAGAMVEAGVDHIGSVILSADQWRKSTIKEVVDLVRQAPAKSSLIFLYQEKRLVFSSLEYYRPDIVHFCEMLVDPKTKQILADMVRTCLALQSAVHERYPEIKIMRSIPIPRTGKAGGFPVLELARLFEPVSDYFLTDTLIMEEDGSHDQPVSGFVGITGKTCDWEMAGLLVHHSRIPVILAGGLSPDNVYEGIVQVQPAGVDSCTLTNRVNDNGEPIRFIKDREKVRRFVTETRRAEKQRSLNLFPG